MTYVISYDIESNKIRTKLAKLLEGYGVRIQYSVFECSLSDKRFKKLYQEIFKLTGENCEGIVRFYPICTAGTLCKSVIRYYRIENKRFMA